MSSGNAPSDREQLLLELENLEALFCDAKHSDAIAKDAASDTLNTAPENIPTLKVEVPILRDVVLQPTLQMSAKPSSQTSHSATSLAPASNPTQVSEGFHFSEGPQVSKSSQVSKSPQISKSSQVSKSSQNLSPDATTVLPPIDPLPSAQPLTQGIEHTPHNPTFAFLDSISSSSDQNPLKHSHKDCASDDEDLMYLTVDDDEVDEILEDVMAEIIPIIERKLRKKLRKRLKRMLSTQA